MTTDLTVCIPTYNDAEYLSFALDSLREVAVEGMEIVVSDNSSTDNTGDIIENYKKIYPNLIHHKFSANVGAAKNFLKAVELASGKYCVLMGSDDAFVPGGLRKIFKEITTGCDIYMYNSIFCNMNMEPVTGRRYFKRGIPSREFDLSGDNGLVEMISSSRYLGALFALISVVVFKRERWLSVEPLPEIMDESFRYMHLYMFWKSLAGGGRVKYINDYLLSYRLNIRGADMAILVKRDFEGFGFIIKHFWGQNPKVTNAAKALMRRDNSYLKMLQMRCVAGKERWDNMRVWLRWYEYNRFLVGLCGFFGGVIAKLHLYDFMRFSYLKLTGTSNVDDGN
jgi:abequosyltransferase